jgi:hypothetical protein
MTAMIASTAEEKTNLESSRPSGKSSRRAHAIGEAESTLGTRFFLSKPVTNGSGFELGRECSSEGEARVEALKAGATYYSVQEWRSVADFAGRNPELKREAVTSTRKSTSHAPE